jgi:hypothetical protein
VDYANANVCPWQFLQEHFRYHARLVNYFKSAEAPAVIAMWETGANASGEPLSPFERDALVERYCELFGCWPE